MSMIISVADSLPFDRLCAFIWSNLGGLKFDSQQKTSQAKSKMFRVKGKKMLYASAVEWREMTSWTLRCFLLLELLRGKTLRTHLFCLEYIFFPPTVLATCRCQLDKIIVLQLRALERGCCNKCVVYFQHKMVSKRPTKINLDYFSN